MNLFEVLGLYITFSGELQYFLSVGFFHLRGNVPLFHLLLFQLVAARLLGA